VFENDRDKVLGIVTLKDLFALTTRPGFALKQCIVEPRYLLENTLAYDALEVFIDSKVHYGIVTDEFGLLQGILTINDILEALVGDVSDFHTEDYTIVNREDGSWLIDGNYPFYDFLSFLELTEIAPEYDINTVAGLVLHHLNNIPTVGEKITWLNYEIEVIDMDGARIDKILLKKQKE